MEMRDRAQDGLTPMPTTPPDAPATDMMPAQSSDSADAQTVENCVHQQITMEMLLENARTLAEKDPADISGDDVRRLRQQFNTLHKAIPADDSAENTSDEFEAEPLVDEFHSILDGIRSRKAAWAEEQEKLKISNLEKKNSIIAEIALLAEDTDNVNRTFPRYRELVEEFNATGDVPPTEETSLWKRFSDVRERFSDNLKINKELRDYDFRKNLEAKQEILDEARRLTVETDIIEAYRRLGDLHNDWRRIGPVAKELRDQLWEDFKTASTEIRRRYQEHFEARKAEELKNEQEKTAICESLEAIDLDTLNSPSAWDKATETVKAAQEKWRTIGFAARKANNTLYNRYRAFCDRFFEQKAKFYRDSRETQAANLAAKTAIVEKAEALKDSTDWRSATDSFVEMQKEWKAIGNTPRRQGEELWKRFISACDFFFEQKKKQGSDQRMQQQANLKAKREVTESLEAIPDDATRETILDALRNGQQKWQEIGHVPFKDKDKAYDRYHQALDRLRSMLDRLQTRRNMDRFESNMAGIEGNQQKMYRERERLTRAAEAKRQEIRTYENNIGFLSSKSKSGDSMLRDFQRRIDRIKAELDALTEKIKLLDSKM
ncbi:MAG: DUF349 domain-containing protein [Muribaculaceae bacterium]|nr:DUF349 domain-containing protein [Muribaculaceae bacterium]